MRTRVAGSPRRTDSSNDQVFKVGTNVANSMMVIFPYRDHGTWMFDDASVGCIGSRLCPVFPR